MIAIPAALACASLIFGIPNLHQERALTIVANARALDRLCGESGNVATKAAGGCNAAFLVIGETEVILARTTGIDWETQVAESCHVLQHRAGLPMSEVQCHHTIDWRQFYAARIRDCSARGISP